MTCRFETAAVSVRGGLPALHVLRARTLNAAALGLALAVTAAGPDASAGFFLFDEPSYAAPPIPSIMRESEPRRARKHRPKQVDRADPSEKSIPPLAAGPLQIVISINSQRLTLYSNGVAVAQSRVSTGVPDHPTPTGIFSVIEKQRFHRSNLYSDAPMPFMQRITWSGVALHEGVVPGRPASHGCIRMPAQFARQMWATTKRGARVIIARGDVVPVEIAHPRLLVPKVTPPEPPAAPTAPVADQPARRAAADGPIKTAEMTNPATKTDAVALRGAIRDGARRSAGVIELIRSAAQATAKLPDGLTTIETLIDRTFADVAKTADAIAAAKKASDHTRMIEAMRRAGPISVFVSRKEKKVFVRHKFTPVFEAPVTIRDMDAPLGTHVFMALEVKDDGAAMRWNVASMPTAAQNAVEPPKKHRRGRADRDAPLEPLAALPPTEALAALDRIEIPQDTIDRISELLTPGASLIISDQGMGQETGRGTDFIIVTR